MLECLRSQFSFKYRYLSIQLLSLEVVGYSQCPVVKIYFLILILHSYCVDFSQQQHVFQMFDDLMSSFMSFDCEYSVWEYLLQHQY